MAESFDPACEPHVIVSGDYFFFEPWCAEFTPPGPGTLVIAFGDKADRRRGVEVSVRESTVTIWVPVGGRVWWCPSPTEASEQGVAWEHRLRALNHETGELSPN